MRLHATILLFFTMQPEGIAFVISNAKTRRIVWQAETSTTVQHGSSSMVAGEHHPRRQNWYSSTLLLAANKGASPSSNIDPRNFVRQGMEAFRQGDVEGSIGFFDEAEQIGGPKYTPFLWQRGISYYYADRFKEASTQFRIDTKLNPGDTEEIVWDIASQLRAEPSLSFPVASQMSLPPGTQDPRRIMSSVYKLFRGEGTEYELAEAGHSGSVADEFYALFYLGLFNEARGESAKAASYMHHAVLTDYVTGTGQRDYMTAVAKLHCKLRGWK